nr:MAG TPA: hypothetical protein [Bacteriophage sp.]
MNQLSGLHLFRIWLLVFSTPSHGISIFFRVL